MLGTDLNLPHRTLFPGLPNLNQRWTITDKEVRESSRVLIVGESS